MERELKGCCLRLQHHQQHHNWDCGISSVLMTLSQRNRTHFIKNIEEICRTEGFSKSTWTIDLCYLLKRYNVNHTYNTITFGVHPAHKTHSFYEKVMSKDEMRITKRFNEAKSNGLDVRLSGVSLENIVNHLARNPIIALLNNKLLYCKLCGRNHFIAGLRNYLSIEPSYQGHYVVLCGFHLDENLVYFRNPACDDHVCAMDLLQLEKARKCYGTDEDIIFIHDS